MIDVAPVFADAERERIRAKLLETGYELFTTYGLKKTSLDDLTRPAGIARSTFYSFFDSKEALFLELLMAERPEAEKRLYEGALHTTDDPREAIARALRASVDELETNPLVRRFLTHPEELQAVYERVGPEHWESDRLALAPLVEFLADRQRRGEVIAEDADVLVGIHRAVAVLTMHRFEIGEDVYPRVVDRIIEFVAAGLTASNEQ